MPQIDIKNLTDQQKVELVKNRWDSSESVWEIVKRVYQTNTAIYSNQADWLDNIAYKRKPWKVQANRIFVNTEAVINSLIANPAGINILPGRDGIESQNLASTLESYFRKKFEDLNFKETVRMGLRNLYFARLLVVKPYWDAEANDFAFRAVDPRKVRFAKHARNEKESEFAIEEIEDNLCSIIDRFPKKQAELMKKFGLKDDNDLYIKNPDAKYEEAWIQDYVIFRMENIILDTIKNPYWDWDGILITEEEKSQIEAAEPGKVKDVMTPIKLAQLDRMPMQTESEADEPDTGETDPNENYEEGEQQNYDAYFFNYFDRPRKPYIFATVLNNENKPIGRTDFITLSADLQRGIDKRKMDIDENCEMVNGMLKVDAAVMGKADAQRIAFETKGIIWGKGVKEGVTREVGQPLPQMVFDDMQDSRNEIDNIMAASSAFRGEREGTETKAGRLALIQQSFLRLNELVQVVDYVSKEAFEWALQFAKTRYTEPHYAKWVGPDEAQQIITILQDDIEEGQEVKVIPGKTLPQDEQFKFEQAQADVMAGLISPVDYVRIAKYDDPKEIAKNAVVYKQNPAEAVGLAPDEIPLPSQPGEFSPDQMEAILAQPAPQAVSPEMAPPAVAPPM